MATAKNPPVRKQPTNPNPGSANKHQGKLPVPYGGDLGKSVKGSVGRTKKGVGGKAA